MNMQAGMQPGTAPLLKRHRVFHSHDAEETRAFLGGKGYKFDHSPRQAGQLNTRINAFYMPGMYLGYMDYGSLPVELSPGVARSDFLLQLPVRGHLAARMVSRATLPAPSSCRRCASGAGWCRARTTRACNWPWARPC